LNRRFGAGLRRRLFENVQSFREMLPDYLAVRSLFPVQPLKLPEGIDAREVHRALLSRGVRAVLHRDSAGGGLQISFVLTARHRPDEIDRAAGILADAVVWQGAEKGDRLLCPR
jgi:7-keto-8-aminopelargonate synthetase-like enzyme